MLLSSMKEMNLKMTKDYTLLIGKKFGDREILDIVKKQRGKENRTFAICKCKCGSIDEVNLSKLRAGQRQRCRLCTSLNKNKSTGMKNISYDRARDTFNVVIERNGEKVFRRTRTLDEAVLTKKLLLEHFTKYGHFDTEKLNDSYYTRKQRHSFNKPHGKDYSYLIGQIIGDHEIIHVNGSSDIEWRKRTVLLRDEYGHTKQIKLKSALTALKRQATKPHSLKSNTNIKNISYNKWTNRYYVGIIRNGVLKTGSSKDLEEAIKIKERILKEFEEENVSNG